jgi:glycine/D-amino acid oxidase-like deaminating enzyme
MPERPGQGASSLAARTARRSSNRRRATALSPRNRGYWRKGSRRFGPPQETDIGFRWSGTFDTTSDGLPLIGPVPGAKGVYAAYGYGGNGITFSFLAACLIGDLIAGKTSPLLVDFAIDRDGGKTG